MKRLRYTMGVLNIVFSDFFMIFSWFFMIFHDFSWFFMIFYHFFFFFLIWNWNMLQSLRPYQWFSKTHTHENILFRYVTIYLCGLGYFFSAIGAISQKLEPNVFFRFFRPRKKPRNDCPTSEIWNLAQRPHIRKSWAAIFRIWKIKWAKKTVISL